MSDGTNSGNFFAELKRRNVYKVAIAYAIVAWLLIQAASILFPTFEAPAWVMKVFATAIILGFPVALIFAWAFEITPEGIKRAEVVSPKESITVLPFENLSDEKQNAFFTDGVQDEILTDLAKIADLKVISRTSVMQYKS